MKLLREDSKAIGFDLSFSSPVIGGLLFAEERMIDPRHSRPIDVHRWSDHPEVNALVLSLWEQHFQKEIEGQKRGPKPKTRHRDQFKVLLLDLYVAWQQDPELSIGVHLNNSEWKTNSRYNALHLSKVIVVYIHISDKQKREIVDAIRLPR
jgi:hypothetical protein